MRNNKKENMHCIPELPVTKKNFPFILVFRYFCTYYVKNF